MPIRRRGTQARLQPRRRVALTRARHQRFELILERAIAGLPAPMTRLLENVAIVIDDEPTREQLREGGMGPHESMYGLYEGTPAVEYDAGSVPLPNKITLFRLPLEEDFPDPLELAEEIRRTLVHELAHHAGFDEDRLHSLDFD